MVIADDPDEEADAAVGRTGSSEELREVDRPGLDPGRTRRRGVRGGLRDGVGRRGSRARSHSAPRHRRQERDLIAVPEKGVRGRILAVHGRRGHRPKCREMRNFAGETLPEIRHASSVREASSLLGPADSFPERSEVKNPHDHGVESMPRSSACLDI
jgi:hypothetical protein